MYPLIEFLLIEDNPGDVRLTQECFRMHKIANPLNVVSNSGQALKFLRQQEEYESVNLPDIIMSCNSIFRDSAYEQLLGDLQADPRLKDVPLVILTEFAGEESHAHNLPHNSLFLPKPLNMDGLCHILHHLRNVEFVICKDA